MATVTSTRGLSKSKYTSFSQCPKALWLKTYKPEEEIVDESTMARFEQGNEVGDLAMGLFGPYVEVTTTREDGSLDLKAMVDKTQEEMAKGTEVICEASFTFDGNYCAVDVLKKTETGWAIYEVKSSSFPESKGEKAKLDKYVPDIAYQKWVLTQCGVNVTGTYLVCLNKGYVRQGELDINRLFVITDMKEMIANEYNLVPTKVKQAMKIINSDVEPAEDLSESCHKPYACGFWEYCKRAHGVPSPSVFNVYGGKTCGGFTFKRKLECYRKGCLTYEDLWKMNETPTGEDWQKGITKIQLMQLQGGLTGAEFIDHAGIKEFLDTLSYPLYFLDFETMQDAVPQYDGAKVYGQITFQYSLHILESPSTPINKATVTHKEFLAPSDGSDPRRALAEQLCRDIPMNACTLAYNKSFECTRIHELAELYPDLAGHLTNIEDHILDLLDPFQKGMYYVPAMGGSFSIKSVLPALYPNEQELDYHNLDSRVQHGGNAMTIFPKIKDMDPEEAAASREALLRYCELDTWAMVKVWEKLMKA